jgi:hypothetical protein
MTTFLTLQDLIDFAWTKYSLLWLEEDVKKLIREKKLRPTYLGGRMVFKSADIEAYFDQR